MKFGRMVIFYLLIFPAFIFSEDFEARGKCIDGPLRIRSTWNLTGDITGKLNTGDEFIVLGKNSYQETIGSDKAFWYKIKYQNTTGYVFGAFIEIIENSFESYGRDGDNVMSIYNALWIRTLLYKSREGRLYNTPVVITDSEITYFDRDKKEKTSGEYYILKHDLDNRRYLVKNSESEYGWIDMDTTIFENYIKDEKYGRLLVRNGPMSFCSSDAGYIEFFDHRGEEFATSHSIIDIILERYVVVHSVYYESQEYRIFDLSNKNEEIYTVLSGPHYGGQYFFCSGNDRQGNYHLELFSVAGGKLIHILSYQIPVSNPDDYDTYMVSEEWTKNDLYLTNRDGLCWMISPSSMQKGEWGQLEEWEIEPPMTETEEWEMDPVTGMGPGSGY